MYVCKACGLINGSKIAAGFLSSKQPLTNVRGFTAKLFDILNVVGLAKNAIKPLEHLVESLAPQ